MVQWEGNQQVGMAPGQTEGSGSEITQPTTQPNTGSVNTYTDAQGNVHVVEDYTSSGGARYDTVVGGFYGGYSGFQSQGAGTLVGSSVQRAAETNPALQRATAEMIEAGYIQTNGMTGQQYIDAMKYNEEVRRQEQQLQNIPTTNTAPMELKEAAEAARAARLNREFNKQLGFKSFSDVLREGQPKPKPMFKDDSFGIFTGIATFTKKGLDYVEKNANLPKAADFTRATGKEMPGGAIYDIGVGGVEMAGKGILSLPFFPGAAVSVGKKWSEEPGRAPTDVMEGFRLTGEAIKEKPVESLIALGIGMKISGGVKATPKYDTMHPSKIPGVFTEMELSPKGAELVMGDAARYSFALKNLKSAAPVVGGSAIVNIPGLEAKVRKIQARTSGNEPLFQTDILKGFKTEVSLSKEGMPRTKLVPTTKKAVQTLKSPIDPIKPGEKFNVGFTAIQKQKPGRVTMARGEGEFSFEPGGILNPKTNLMEPFIKLNLKPKAGSVGVKEIVNTRLGIVREAKTTTTMRIQNLMSKDRYTLKPTATEQAKYQAKRFIKSEKGEVALSGRSVQVTKQLVKPRGEMENPMSGERIISAKPKMGYGFEFSLKPTAPKFGLTSSQAIRARQPKSQIVSPPTFPKQETRTSPMTGLGIKTGVELKTAQRVGLRTDMGFRLDQDTLQRMKTEQITDTYTPPSSPPKIPRTPNAPSFFKFPGGQEGRKKGKASSFQFTEKNLRFRTFKELFG